MEPTVDRLKQDQRMFSWLRKIYPTLTDADKEEARQIFPEVLESEDERIREELIGHCKDLVRMNQDDKVMLSVYEPWLAWLERQKDLFINKDVIVAIEKYLDWLTGYPDYAPKGKYSIQDMLHCLSAIVKPEEQKPIENSTRTKIISRATTEKQVVLLSESNGNAEIGWDTRSLEDTKNLLEYGIAFINKQLGVKSAEWSEEDEDMRDTIIRDLKHLGGDIVNVNPAYKPEIDWLKSLRPQPHWKPSEEQMKALNEIINTLAVSSQPHENDYLFNMLHELRRDLKKL